ncbi:MAG: hypothetical protein QOK33_3395 [Mycobacterium sp.]|nr:hypothetical protein [Mycobacterium sp.]
MQGTGGSAETLGVDPKSLSNLGNDMLSAADDIPPPPAPFTVSGTDPVSTKIMGMQASLETPIQTGLPEAKTGAKKTANSIVAAATKYEKTDEQLAKQIEEHTFDKPGTPSVGGGLGGAQGVVGIKGNPAETTGFSTPNRVGGKIGGDAPTATPPSAPTANADAPATATPGGATPGPGAPASGAAGGLAPAGTPAPGAASSAASRSAESASSGASQMGQIGQFISMPMQMAGQAIGMAAAVPQTIMQGVESAVQQVSQLTGGHGQDGGSSVNDAQLTADHEGDESSTRPDEPAKPDQAHDGAAPGQPQGERAPDGQPGGTRADTQQAPAPPTEQKPPAQTRPAEAAQQLNL